MSCKTECLHQLKPTAFCQRICTCILSLWIVESKRNLKRKIFGSVKNAIIMAQRSSMYLRVTSIVHPCRRRGSLTKTHPHTTTRVLIGWLHFSNAVANISQTLKRLNLQVQSILQTFHSPYREELEETEKKEDEEEI